MAQCTVTRAVPATPPIETVTLVLSPLEAKAIRVVLGKVTGTGPLRKACDRMYESIPNEVYFVLDHGKIGSGGIDLGDN
jgi:Ni,Fe-hydrogenase III small subunit